MLDRSDVHTQRTAVRDDMIALRLAYAEDDASFARALEQTALEIMRALQSPDTWGDELRHGLRGWRRSKYASAKDGERDLRLVFRPHEGGGVDVVAFAHRHSYDAEGNPATAYRTAGKRTGR